MAFAFLFAVEMVVKWIALGFKYYFSSVWTALDFVIVTVSRALFFCFFFVFSSFALPSCTEFRIPTWATVFK